MTLLVVIALWVLALGFFLVLVGGVRRGDSVQRRALLGGQALPRPGDAPPAPERAVFSRLPLRREPAARAAHGREVARRRH
jgi:hypothetical protein